MPIFRLTRELVFPDPELASPEGILAVGADLTQKRLLLAYRRGIFPWPHEGMPLTWWSPDPRCVLFPEKLRITKSMARVIKSGRFTITEDTAFRDVMQNCRHVKRRHEQGTWITPAMVTAYTRLHEAGHAHSVEVWEAGALVGGLYGVAVGSCFCGESMFARVSNASKAALIHLVRAPRPKPYTLIDCQLRTDHLVSMGAVEMPRSEYLRLLAQAAGQEP